ncbi:hypothetical protein DV735_g2162, partial [Chaetothyriales sp. CBS 134920]
MPPVQQLNPGPHPFWDFVAGLEDHPFFAPYGPPPRPAFPADVDSHEGGREAEDPPEAMMTVKVALAPVVGVTLPGCMALLRFLSDLVHTHGHGALTPRLPTDLITQIPQIILLTKDLLAGLHHQAPALSLMLVLITRNLLVDLVDLLVDLLMSLMLVLVIRDLLVDLLMSLMLVLVIRDLLVDLPMTPPMDLLDLDMDLLVDLPMVLALVPTPVLITHLADLLKAPHMGVLTPDLPLLSGLSDKLGIDLVSAAENAGVPGFFGPHTRSEVDFEPEMDIFDTPTHYIIHLSLPGAKKQDVGVDWDGENSELRIAGVVHRPGVDEETLSYLVINGRKRENGVFEKVIRLGTRAEPASIDAAGITAKMTDGVLIIAVPKVQVEQRKREIRITSSATPSPPPGPREEKDVLFEQDKEMYDTPDDSTKQGVRHLKCQSQPVTTAAVMQSGWLLLKFRHGSKAKYDTIFGKDQPWLSQTRNGRIQFVDQGPELENFYSQTNGDSVREGANLPDTADITLDEATPTRVDDDSSVHSPSDRVQASLAGTKHGVDSTADESSIPPKRSFRSKSPPRSFRSKSPPRSFRSKSPPRSFRSKSPPTPSPRRIDPGPSSGVYDPVRSFYVLPQQPKAAVYVDFNDVTVLDVSNNVPRRVEAEYRRLADTQAATIPPEELLTPEVWKSEFYWPNDFTTTQCACLMRYFIQQLAPWFDVGDPERTFALTVPQRARRCPPLLNAIFTAAARHLAAKPAYKNKNNVIVYQNTELPSLTVNTAIYYHQACIEYLKKLGKDEVSIQDENLLAAAIILRYFEELDHSLSGDGSSPKFVAFDIFVNAQAHYQNCQINHQFEPLLASPLPNWSALTLNSAPTSVPAAQSRVVLPPLRTRAEVIAELKNFRHACFRVALRQEVATAFLKQQSISTALSDTWALLSSTLDTPSSSRNDDPDFIHSDRHLLHCAQVLQYCFGTTAPASSPRASLSPSSSSALAHTDNYHALKQYQRNWRDGEPYSFQPIHYLSAISTVSVFKLPQIWYIAEIHTLALSYLDLADILLTVYDPALPRLGPNAAREQKRVGKKVREIVVRLCGAAMSSPDSESACIQAYLAIVVCGEHFVHVGRKEQEALWAVLDWLETKWGRPTRNERKELEETWGW